MNRLLILSTDAGSYEKLIKAAHPQGLEIQASDSVASAMSTIADSNIILGDPALVSAVLAAAKQLQWVQSSWAGVDQFCRPDLRKDYVLTGVKGVFGPMISEYVMTYLFALERQLFRMRSNQLEQRWEALSYRPARDITMGIIGLGSIGRQLAHIAAGFGLRVTGHNRSGKPCDGVDKVYTKDDLVGFFAEPDYVVLTLPDTPATEHFIDGDILEMMKPTAVLMNVGRGSIINEPDLVAALSNGVIAGAVLDVFAHEPLPTHSPLWQMPQVYITPHHAATSFPEDIVGIFMKNYQRFLQHESLLYAIDFELGY